MPLVDYPLQDSPYYHNNYTAANVKGAQESNNGIHGDVPIPELWTPFILRKATLVGLACLFLLMIVVLEVIFYLSNKYQGISTSDPQKHYLWTYGPTVCREPIYSYKTPINSISSFNHYCGDLGPSRVSYQATHAMEKHESKTRDSKQEHTCGLRFPLERRNLVRVSQGNSLCGSDHYIWISFGETFNYRFNWSFLIARHHTTRPPSHLHYSREI